VLDDTYILFGIFYRLLDLCYQRLQHTNSIPFRRKPSDSLYVEQLPMQPVLNASVAKQLFWWPSEEVWFDKLKVLAAKEQELWVHSYVERGYQHIYCSSST
jgi:hypothetical protein